MESIEEYLSKFAKEAPNKLAVIVKDTYTSYEQLWKEVQGLAYYLKTDCEVERGDRVVVKASQTLSYVISYFATHLAGAVFVPLEKNIPDNKAVEIIEETDAKIYISNIAIEKEGLRNIAIKAVEALAETYFNSSWEYDFPSGIDSADIMYTTGTTGKAKGVEVTHSVLLATAENYISGFEIKRDNVIAVPGPMNHVNPLRKLYMSIMNGSTIVILNGLISMKAFFHALDEQGVTSLCLPPASLRTIWHFSQNKLADYAEQIDFVECSTAPVTESDKETLRKQLPKSRLYNNYGLSECGAMVMYDFNRYRSKGQGCVGVPMINSQVVIVDDERKEIISSKDNVGLIANKGPINMKGYWKAPEITSQVKENGYIYTNDIGYFDEEGFLYVIGRKNDTINVGGLKVEPTEVEEAAFLTGDIHECICVAVDDGITDSALKLLVVMKEGKKFDKKRIAGFLQKSLDAYKIPKIIEEINEVPKNYVGKPDRKAFVNGVVKKG